MNHKYAIEYEGVNGKREFANTDKLIINGTLFEENDDAVSRNAVLKKIFLAETSPIGSNNILKELSYSVENMPSVTPRQKWIPVSESVPDYGVDVLCWTSYGHYKVCFRDYLEEKNKGNAWTTATFKPVEVVAWMPLPEPYKKEGEEKCI